MDVYLPTIFVGLLGLSVLIYAILDGYDLGVGMLLPLEATRRGDRDVMIASIGPFWDANETWLVMAVGLMLIAFPAAHSIVFQHLYLPAFFMLLGLILRGVAFDFRTKAAVSDHAVWERCFRYGSLLTALAQGYMLGAWVVGFDQSLLAESFKLLSAVGVATAYAYIGACWLVFKTEGHLQHQAVRWATYAGRGFFLGVVAVCAVNLAFNPQVFARWFAFPLVMFVLLLPLGCIGLYALNEYLLRQLRSRILRYHVLPFLLTAALFAACFVGLAFSFYPFIVPGQMTIAEAASDAASLRVILWGALIVVPIILVYTAFAYYVFRGKASQLNYY